jgi:hypothetical protein
MHWIFLFLVLPRLLKWLFLIALGVAGGILATRLVHVPMSPCIAFLVPIGFAVYFIAVMHQEWPDSSDDGRSRTRHSDSDS